MTTDLDIPAAEIAPATLKGRNGRTYPVPLLRLLELVERIASLPDISNSARRRADYLAREALKPRATDGGGE